jgi:hypothetical protein
MQVVMFSADYIFSNEHINFLVTYPFDFRIDEMLSYYISFLRFVTPAYITLVLLLTIIHISLPGSIL